MPKDAPSDAGSKNANTNYKII